MNKNRFFRSEALSFLETRISEENACAFKPHFHPTFSIAVLEEGENHFDYHGKRYHLEPGYLGLISPDTVHACNPPTKKPRSFHVMYLDVDWCTRIQKGLFSDISAFQEPHHPVLRDRKTYERFIALNYQMFDESFFLVLESELTELVSDIFQKTCVNRIKTPLKVDSTLIISIQQHLDQTLHSNLSLATLAETFEMNPYVLLRQFKKQTGTTPHAYQLNRRIDNAKKLLREGCPIVETALESGFSDQSHFHRHFKRIVAATPREYQISMQP